MTLERLWAGWRAEYMEAVTTSPPPDACLFCSLAVAPSEDEALIIDRNDLVYAVLNAYPYTSGHLMVVPVRHEGRLEALTDEEARALLAMLQRATSVVQATYHPEGMNVGMNLGRAGGAGVPGHLHVHVVPRWIGDTNFMTSVAEARVLPEPLTETCARLRSEWRGASEDPHGADLGSGRDGRAAG